MKGVRHFLFTAGNGDLGRLGLGDALPRTKFSLCSGFGSQHIERVACGAAHTAALADVFLFTFGDNTHGQLGHSPELRFVPVPRAVPMPPAVAAACGYSHTLAVSDEGDVWGWGRNQHGQTGQRASRNAVDVPAMVRGLPRIVQVAAGAEHSLALSVDGECFAWGNNASGAAGLPSEGGWAWGRSESQRAPRLLRALLPHGRVRSISAGYFHSLALMESGVCFGWGKNEWWQLGLGHSNPVSEPTPIPGLSDVRELYAGGFVSAGLQGFGSLLLCGTGFNGAVPEGLPDPCKTPAPVPGQYFESAAVGWKACAGVGAHGQLLTWGWNGAAGEHTVVEEAHGLHGATGQLGHGDNRDRRKPTPIQTVLVSDPKLGFGGPALELPQTSDDHQLNWRAEKVACGVDHMAAVVSMDAEMLAGMF